MTARNRDENADELIPGPTAPGDPRSFTETGWGRFPIALNSAGLHPFPFALYVRLSVLGDTGGDIPDLPELARLCAMTDDSLGRAIEILKLRRFLTIEGESWKLNDPTEWLP